jgi:hypothetical protein
MKKLASFILSIALIQPAYAGETATLHLKISGAMGNTPYFLCVSNVGCVKIKSDASYPMSAGNINYIFPMTLADLRLHHQIMPKSCDVAVESNQTVTVTGKLKMGPNAQMYINNLNCKVSS